MTARRILAAHPLPGLYGADRMMLRALAALTARGHEVSLVVPHPGPLLEEFERAGIAVHILRFSVLRKALLRPLRLAGLTASAPSDVLRLWRFIRKTRPDLVYVNTVTVPVWLLAARLARVPAICHVREAETQASDTMARILLQPLRLATAIATNSAATRTWVLRYHPRLNDRARVIYNGFAFAETATARPPLAGRRAVLAVVGRLAPRKGQDLAVRAVRDLAAAGFDVELRLVGDVFPGYEWYESDLRAAAADLGDRVVFDGFLDDPTAAYAGADVVLVPSRLEPFGNVAVEAMACGRPVVASRAGGLPEIVDDGLTGLLFEPDDAPDLAACVTRLLNDPTFAAELAAAGAVAVRERFGEAAYATQLAELVEATAQRWTGR